MSGGNGEPNAKAKNFVCIIRDENREEPSTRWQIKDLPITYEPVKGVSPAEIRTIPSASKTPKGGLQTTSNKVDAWPCTINPGEAAVALNVFWYCCLANEGIESNFGSECYLPSSTPLPFTICTQDDEEPQVQVQGGELEVN